MEAESAPKRTEVQGQEKPAEGERRGPGIRLPAGQRCCQTVASGGWCEKTLGRIGASEGIFTTFHAVCYEPEPHIRHQFDAPSFLLKRKTEHKQAIICNVPFGSPRVIADIASEFESRV